MGDVRNIITHSLPWYCVKVRGQLYSSAQLPLLYQTVLRPCQH